MSSKGSGLCDASAQRNDYRIVYIYLVVVMQLVESFVEPRQVHHTVPDIFHHALPHHGQQSGCDDQF